MFNYPVEKNSLRFYKYKFYGFEKPLIIEAQNKLHARQMLTYFLEKNPQYQGVSVISESLSLPIFGETTKIINGVEHVWVGELSYNNWMPLDEFQNLNYE